MTPADILKKLGEAFPPTAIKQRDGGRGRRFDYIETHTCIHRLNGAAVSWDFYIRNTEWHNDLLIVHGELTIPGLGTRSGLGVQRVMDNAGEDLVKGAASDALKKCATLFGVGLELYGPDYASGEVDMRQDRPQAASGGPGRIGPTEKQWGLIRSLLRDLSLSEDQANAFVEREFGAQIDALDGRDVSRLIDRLKAKRDGQ